MQATPEDIVGAAHRHELHAQEALGLGDAAVLAHAPPELRSTGTRAAFVVGLRQAARLYPGGSLAHPHLAMADALYWCLAHRSLNILQPRRHCLHHDQDDAGQEGLLWLHKAAQRFRPGCGPWKRYAISWLMAGGARSHTSWISLHDRAMLSRLHRLMGEADARGQPLSRAQLADAVDRPVQYVEWLLTAESALSYASQEEPDYLDRLPPLEDADEDQQHAPLDVDLLLARVSPREAWALARRAGLWGTPETPCARIAAELGMTAAAVAEMIREARIHLAKPGPSGDLWPLDRRGLRWAVQATTTPIQALAAREGLRVSEVEAAVAACRDEIGLQPVTEGQVRRRRKVA